MSEPARLPKLNPELLKVEKIDLVAMSSGEITPELVEHATLRETIYRWDNNSNIEDATPRDVQSYLSPTQWQERHAYHIRYSDRLVGRAFLEFPLEEDSKLSYLTIELLPEFRGQGIGRIVLPMLEQKAREAGRTVLEGWTSHRSSDFEPLVASTGFGSVPKDVSTLFMLAHGYSLGQVERMSIFDYRESAELLSPLHKAALDKAGPDYEYLHWLSPIPSEYIADFAAMKRQMSVDAPTGDVEFDEEIWDEARVLAYDAKVIDHGRTRLTGVIRHIPSGDLVAYTELELGTDPSAATNQQDTFVLNAHRGHALGMLAKTENMLRWRELHPESDLIYTYNAEENSYMLGVNVAMGFTPASYGGMWKKVITL
ncbi:MAG: GNAT family N-acetyltransferase [Microbacteriaceae bacterium]